jgi:IclR family acetate operon transcriptional repressor
MGATKEEPETPLYPIGSVGNALAVLLMFREHSSIRIADAAERLSVARSTAHRLLAMLQHEGFVDQDEATKAYVSGRALVDVGVAVASRLAIRRVARPYMAALSRDTGESVELCILDGTDGVVVDLVEAEKPLRVVDEIGLRAPAHLTAAGKAMLAELPPARIDELFPSPQLETRTPRSVSSRKALQAELKRVRKDGFATNRQESDDELVGVAAAVVDRTGAVRGSVTVPLPRSRADEDFDKTLGPLVVHQARAVSAALDAFEASD